MNSEKVINSFFDTCMVLLKSVVHVQNGHLPGSMKTMENFNTPSPPRPKKPRCVVREPPEKVIDFY